jgi:hypothetical protein
MTFYLIVATVFIPANAKFFSSITWGWCSEPSMTQVPRDSPQSENRKEELWMHFYSIKFAVVSGDTFIHLVAQTNF